MRPVKLHHQHIENRGAADLVITHGLLGSSTNWGRIGKRLAAQHNVWLLDMRNHGRSAHADEMDYPAMAGDIEAWLDEHGIDKATLVGHSMGGKAAMWFALTRPQRLRTLVVVDIAPRPSPGDHRGIIDAIEGLDLVAVGTRADADKLLADHIEEAPLRAWLLQNLVIGTGGARWRINVAAIRRAHDELTGFPSPPTPGIYAGPTLFIRGALSTYVVPEDEAHIKTLFPRARVVSIASAGHWLHTEQPGVFLTALQDFLDEAASLGTSPA